ncbi:hypothetical protein [Halobacterium zhouii]|uniref:hypothetical protein n=1 Tax=Halobacterium zhouii TaxID=2902624 RepID=UPI001E3D0B4E|nr:hypothetical protein [Halobacterium zhouii]
MGEHVYIVQKWYAGETITEYLGTYASEYDALEEAIDFVTESVHLRKGNTTHKDPDIRTTGQYTQRVFHPACRNLWVEVRKTEVRR